MFDLFSFYQMYTKVKENFKDSLSKMGFYAYLIGSILFVFVLSPSGISQRQARNLIYLLGLNFGKLVVKLKLLNFISWSLISDSFANRSCFRLQIHSI